MSTGLFLLRRCSTWMERRISSSRPITGSSLPMRARSVRSMVYFLRASRWPSPSALSMVWPPRTALMADSRLERVTPLSLSSWPARVEEPLLSVSASRNSSLAMNWSPRLRASFSVACSSRPSSEPTCTWSWCCTRGRSARAFSAAACSWPTLAPARCKSERGPSSWRSSATSRCRGSILDWSPPRASVCASARASWNLVVSLSIRMVFLFAPETGSLRFI